MLYSAFIRAKRIRVKVDEVGLGKESEVVSLKFDIVLKMEGIILFY